MAINLARFVSRAEPRWGIVRGAELIPLSGDYPTTAALIEHGENDWRSAKPRRLRSTRSNFYRRSLPRAGSFAKAPIIGSI